MTHSLELNQSSAYRYPARIGLNEVFSYYPVLRSISLQFIVDGPALRATSLIAYGNWLVANPNSSYATSILWPIIKLDLDYVASSWNLTG